MQKITPFLWFDNNAQEAAQFYISVFKDSKILSESERIVQFELNGQRFLALNGGPAFKFSEAISFIVDCQDQAEVDYYWERLGANGQTGQCGWLKDKFGLSWQVVPEQLGVLMSDSDEERAGRVMRAMLQMHKLDIAGLEAAYRGE